MIKIINLSKSFGNQTLLKDINFNINPKERIGLIGRNGYGKTTLLKMIIKDEFPDSGEIVIPKNYSIGFVTQHLHFTKKSVVEEGSLGLPDHEKDEKWKVEKILFGLGFSKDDMLRSPMEFSGGYQVRLNLGKVLISEPNLLLLDEPTNYLDIVSIRWLANFLRQWKNELILVTHDRSFMDSITTHTIGIHRKRAKKIEGNTDKFYEQILKEEEVYEKTRINDEKKSKDAEQFINRFRAKARLAGLVQSRIKALQKKEKLEKLEKIKTFEFTFNYKEFTGKTLMHIKDMTFSYHNSGKPLINNVNLSIGKNDRICIIGKNGKGKTTLLKLIAQELEKNSGEIISHPGTQIGYFAQTNIIQLNELLTVEDEIMNVSGNRQMARDICGAMMFEGDTALKKIAVLSGGEKSRVLLGKILATKANLILLDEPTNHLDMEACDALLAAIDEFDGAVVIVTHNELFLHTLANRFIVFQDEKISLFEGSYQDFLDKIGWEDEEQPQKNRSKDNPVNKKDLRKQRADILLKKSKILKPIETKISELESSIETLEKIHVNLSNEMIAASGTGNGNKISELSKQIHKTQLEIDNLYNELDLLTKEYDEKVKLLDKEANELLAIEN